MNPETLRDFLADAGGHGPVVGMLRDDALTRTPSGLRVRNVDATAATTLDDLFTAFAAAWHFPDHFGHSKSAFDDCMRDLDGSAEPGSAPAGFLTLITDAHMLLTDDPDGFDWFAESMPFYRDHYRDHDSQSVFAVLLCTPRRYRDTVRTRWRAAGVRVAEVR
ncbi:barstar family protein [Gordonia sp. NPDC003422]